MKRFLIFFIALCGCDTDFFNFEGIDDPKWNPNVAIPIGYAEYTLQELLNEADSLVEIREDENNFITLVYEQQLFSESAADFLDLVSQSFSETYNINIPPPLPDPVVISGVNFSTSHTLSFTYNTNQNTSIDSILFRNALFALDVTSTVKAEVDAHFTFQNLLVNDQPYNFSVNLDNFGAASISAQFSDSLQNFAVDLHNSDFIVDVKLDVTTYGAPVSSSDQISVEIGLNNLVFESFFGNVGTRPLLLDDERFTYDIFEEFNFGEIYFKDPRLVFTIDNSFGIPVTVDLGGIYAEDPQDGRIDLTGPIVSNPPKVEAPDYARIGESVRSIISVNKDNSNFKDIVSALPTALNLPLDATTNPDGETENFVLDSSRIDIQLAAELPLDLRIVNLGDDVIFDFTSGEIKYVEEALLRINVVNGFPLEGKIKVIFRNDSSNNLLTITPNNDFDNPLFTGAPVDDNGFVTSPSSTTTDIILSSENLDAIEAATEVKVEIELNTTNAASGQTVKLLSTYKVKINLGIETGVGI